MCGHHWGSESWGSDLKRRFPLGGLPSWGPALSEDCVLPEAS